jgi:hypothetical protein
VAIDAPSMIAAGFPTPDWAQTIAGDVFGGKVADWPTLAQPLLLLAASIVMLIGLVGTMIARRHAGALHMLRAIVGVGVLVLAVLPIAAIFYSIKPWNSVAMLPMSQRSVWLVVRTVLEHTNGKAILVPMLAAAFGAFLLALPPRRQSTAAAAAAAAPATSAPDGPAGGTTGATPGGVAQ